ncbi:DUF4429 domain-containing protein [Streptomyces sp. NBC_01754]|uniref:DUF4429 domain-containing protein n=1 Tax=Streptomyces sp. NBC_01754 TaxID=2975930 RepID=UPI002DDACDDA|nr:DUF4429 domain-containing protein [Streptomyces sp. NBC_01754]WSC92589.1 DUF4429 domain-containing protein [Streptomyces sp. NBC_01754]
MADIITRDGTWSFDGETVRIVPGGKVHPVRQDLGELAVPLRAVAGVSFEPERKGGRLRLRLRSGACPVLRAAAGRLKDASDPYQLSVEKDRAGAAEYLVDEVRNALLIEQVPDGPVEHFLLPGPSVPVSGGGGDGTASFDGETVRLVWNWKAAESKTAGGEVSLPVSEVTGVRWVPCIGLENGSLRFDRQGAVSTAPAKFDPYSLDLWGLSKREYTAVLVAAAVLVRMPAADDPRTRTDAAPALPHAADSGALPPAHAPALASAPAPAPAAVAPAAPPAADDHDVLLRRLRELGELHQTGILTDDEFTTAKQAVLKRL